MAEKQIVDFGMADFILDEGLDTELRFDGKLCDTNSLLQAEGGQIELTPMLEEINLADFGNGAFDHYVVGWEGEITITGAKTTLDVIAKTLSGVLVVNDNDTLVSVTDDRLGTSLRETGKTLRIHPRGMGDDKSEDIVIHKVVNTGGLSKSYANERGSYEITFSILPKDCADANKANNFFYIGQDPTTVEGYEDLTTTEDATPSV